MAVAFESVSTQNANHTSNTPSVLTLAKPTGLAVGDMLFLSLKTVGNFSVALSSWTSLLNANYYKFATSSDVALTNFVFTSSDSPSTGGVNLSSLMRISGVSKAQPILASAVDFQTNPSSFSNSITPFIPNCLLIMMLGSNNSSNASSYAIATDNPTWTERVNMHPGPGLFVATAPRSQTTATGNSSISGSTASWSCALFAIPPDKSIEISDTNTVTDDMEALRIRTIDTTDTNVITDSIETIKSRIWETETKHSTVWTNEPKT